ncbi:MAG: DUF3052 family protein [Actinomycetaceae bacterium]|nr:DUF3052 family protein [Actinomycetaceae bacterium]MDY6083060.1 DUF3052 family protein [Actinomycetaceae bacterium]
MKSFDFAKGSVVQEFGYDDDVNNSVRQQIETMTGQALVDEDYDDIADGAIAWWRAEDGDTDDLADLFLDVRDNLDSPASPVWLMIPGPQSEGHVRAAEIEEAADAAGLISTTTIPAGGWIAVRIAARGERR